MIYDDDLEQSRMRLKEGYWKHDFVSQIKHLLIKTNVDTKSEEVEKKIKMFLEKKDSDAFNYLIDIIAFLKDHTDADADAILGYWTVDLFKAVEAIIFMHYILIYMRYKRMDNWTSAGIKYKKKMDSFYVSLHDYNTGIKQKNYLSQQRLENLTNLVKLADIVSSVKPSIEVQSNKRKKME